MEQLLKKDPHEQDPQYREIFEKIDKEVEQYLSNKGYTMKTVGMGYCHMFWGAKAELLKNKYHIDWKSPGEMNPDMYFD